MRNVKGFALSLGFVIIGIFMFVFFISTGFPSLTNTHGQARGIAVAIL